MVDRLNKKRKIVIVDGGRMTFGYIRPVIREIEKQPNLDYEIVVVNTHLLKNFGKTVNEIKRDNFKVGEEIYNTLDGYNRLTMIKSLGILLTELPGVLQRMKPDILLVAGDRGEQFITSMVGSHMYIPVAHIQAGELSGNIDGMTRHAIARYAHIHFAANNDAAQRLLKSGEQKFRIFNVGAPQLDELVYGRKTPEAAVRKKYSLLKTKPAILVVQHSVTEEADDAYSQMAATLKAVSSFNYPTVIILNNSDAGCELIREAVEKYKTSNMKIFEHVSRPDYAGLMKTCDVLVGNSSSGIIESPVFNIPAVNIGNRQKGRMQSVNVINIGYNSQDIKKAISRALSLEFKELAQAAESVYGDGKSAKRITDILGKIPISDKLLVKRMSY